MTDYNLSPLAAGSLSDTVDFRRRLVVERAIVPKNTPLPSWAWGLRFDGYIDAWDVDRDSVQIACSDKSAPLRDRKVLDARSYYPNPVERAEALAQRIITDLTPKIDTDTATVTLGYLGGTPTLWTDYGSVATPLAENSGYNIRYHDVSTDDAMIAPKGIADSIGFDFRFRFYEPWGEYRLEFFDPPRDRTIKITQVYSDADGGNRMVVVTAKPHGLVEGQTVQLSATPSADWDGIGYIGEILGYNAFVCMGHPKSGVATTTRTSGLVGYDPQWLLKQERLTEVEKLSSNIDALRNQITVRFNRDESPGTIPVTLTKVGSEWTLLLPPERSVSEIDPDGLGVEFSLGGATGTATVFNGISSVGQTRGARVIAFGAPSPDPGGPSSAAIFLETEFIRFDKAVSTNTPSVEKYGLHPAAVYEGSTTNIDTFTEAKRLADNILSDLSDPQADWAVRLFAIEGDLHDTFRLEADTNGRWSEAKNTAVVGVKELYSSTECSFRLTLRNSKPTLAQRSRLAVLQDAIRQGPHVRGPQMDLVDLPRPPRFWGFSNRRFNFSWNPPTGKNSWRIDRTEVHLGPTADFIPTRSTLVGTTRGNSFDATVDAKGLDLKPGAKFFPKFRFRDIDGNVSISSAALSEGEVRHADLLTSAKVVRLSLYTTPYDTTGSGFTPVAVTTAQSPYTDSLRRAFDVEGLWSSASRLFSVPVEGEYSITANLHFYLTNDGVAPVATRFCAQRIDGSTGSVFNCAPQDVPVADKGAVSAQIGYDARVWAAPGDSLRMAVSALDASGGTLLLSSMLQLPHDLTRPQHVTFALLNQAPAVIAPSRWEPEVGVAAWYSGERFETMFSDEAGTVPATAGGVVRRWVNLVTSNTEQDAFTAGAGISRLSGSEGGLFFDGTGFFGYNDALPQSFAKQEPLSIVAFFETASSSTVTSMVLWNCSTSSLTTSARAQFGLFPPTGNMFVGGRRANADAFRQANAPGGVGARGRGHALVGVMDPVIDHMTCRANAMPFGANTFVAAGEFPGDFPLRTRMGANLAATPGALFHGILRELVVYNKALDEQEIERALRHGRDFWGTFS